MLRNQRPDNFPIVSVHEILTAIDKLTPAELRMVQLGVESRLANDDEDDPALLAELKEAIAYADAHPGERQIDR